MSVKVEPCQPHGFFFSGRSVASGSNGKENT